MFGTEGIGWVSMGGRRAEGESRDLHLAGFQPNWSRNPSAVSRRRPPPPPLPRGAVFAPRGCK